MSEIEPPIYVSIELIRDNLGNQKSEANHSTAKLTVLAKSASRRVDKLTGKGKGEYYTSTDDVYPLVQEAVLLFVRSNTFGTSQQQERNRELDLDNAHKICQEIVHLNSNESGLGQHISVAKSATFPTNPDGIMWFSSNGRIYRKNSTLERSPWMNEQMFN